MKFRLPDDPARALGGRKRRKKDTRPLPFELQTQPSHLNGLIRKEVFKKKVVLVGSYKRQQLALLRSECRKSVREITSPYFRKLIIDNLRDEDAS